MTCEEIRGRLSADLDGELSAAESEAVRAHLEACAPCGRQSALLRGARDAFRATPRRSPVPRSITAATLAGLLAIAVVAGWGRWRAPQPPEDAAHPESAVARVAADRSAPEHRRRIATDGIDCGRPDAIVCILEVPCGDGRCGGLLEQLRAHPDVRPALDARPPVPAGRGKSSRDV